MTTTANVGTIIVPIGMSTRSGPYKYGSGLVYKISDLKKKKRKKNKYSDIGIAYIDTTNGMNESLSGKRSVDLTKFNGEIGVWRTIKGRHYFFALNKSGPTPPFPFKIKKVKIKKDTGKSGGSNKEKVGTKSKSGSGKSKGAATGKGSNSKSGEKKKDSKKKDNIPNREDILDKVDAMILKASRAKGGKVVLGPLKQMQAALRADDPDAFRKAERAVAKATKKLGKRKGR